MTTPRRILGGNDLLAIELTAALKQGDVERLSRLLADEPDLASCVVRSEKGGGRTPLHLLPTSSSGQRQANRPSALRPARPPSPACELPRPFSWKHNCAVGPWFHRRGAWIVTVLFSVVPPTRRVAPPIALRKFKLPRQRLDPQGILYEGQRSAQRVSITR